MPYSSLPRFSKGTLTFLKKAARQKNPNWLERNREEYENFVLAPLRNLARSLKTELGAVARGYHFPQKGIGRIKRPAHRVAETGGSLFKDWLTYSASRPAESRFDHNPNLFFLINPCDDDDPVLVAGGLYMPSSRQVRAIRESLARERDAREFEKLFASKDFVRCFKGGFAREKVSSRPPRGFDPEHPRMDWLKLQAFYVWRPYRLREFVSGDFPSLVGRDWRQVIRMNELLERSLSRQPIATSDRQLAERLEELGDMIPFAPKPMDF